MFDLKKFLEGAAAQVNPFDGGKTYASVMRSNKPTPPPASIARPKQNIMQQAGGAINTGMNIARNPGAGLAQLGAKKLYSQFGNKDIPGLGVSANDIALQLPSAGKQVLKGAGQVGDSVLGNVSHLADTINYGIQGNSIPGIDTYTSLNKQGKLSDENYLKLMNEAGQKAGYAMGDKGGTVLRKAAGAVAMPTATILTSGTLPAAMTALKGASLANKVTKGAIGGAALGAGFGGITTVGQENPITWQDAAMNIGGGGLLGGVMGGGAPVLGKLLTKGAKTTQPVLSPKTNQAPVMNEPDLTTPQGINDHINFIQQQVDSIPQRIREAQLRIETATDIHPTRKQILLKQLGDEANTEANALKQEQAALVQSLQGMGRNPIPEAVIPNLPTQTQIPKGAAYAGDNSYIINPTLKQKAAGFAREVAQPFTRPAMADTSFMGVLKDQGGYIGQPRDLVGKFSRGKDAPGFKLKPGHEVDKIASGEKLFPNKTYKEYFNNEKGIDGDVLRMSPDQYLQAVIKDSGNYKTVDDIIKRTDMKRVSEYAEAMKKGDKFPMVQHHFNGRGEFTVQEGIHRALAAKQAGLKDMPVEYIWPNGKRPNYPSYKDAPASPKGKQVEAKKSPLDYLKDQSGKLDLGAPKYSKGIAGDELVTKNDMAEILATQRKRFGDEKIKLGQHLEEKGVNGFYKYDDDLIRLVEGKANQGTVDHESIHKAIQQFLPDNEIEQLYRDIVKVRGGKLALTREYRSRGYKGATWRTAAEEEIANVFKDFVKDNQLFIKTTNAPRDIALQLWHWADQKKLPRPIVQVLWKLLEAVEKHLAPKITPAKMEAADRIKDFYGKVDSGGFNGAARRETGYFEPTLTNKALKGVLAGLEDMVPASTKVAAQAIRDAKALEDGVKLQRSAPLGKGDTPPKLPATKSKTIQAIAQAKPAKDPSIIKNEKGDFVREAQTLNPNRLDLDNSQRSKILEATTKEVRTKLTDKQVLEVAKSAGINTRTRTLDETAQRIAEDLNARRAVVDAANKYTRLQASGASKAEVEKAFSETFKQANIAASQGTDAGRVLSARRIIANELDTPMQRVIKLLNKADVDPDKAAKLAVDVNWDDAKSVAGFYRKLVPARGSDWLDLVRYNSMLSSPLTHIVNNTSNALNTGLVAPLEKTLTGGIDFFRSKATGTPRRAFAGEGKAYAKGYANAYDDALDNMIKAFKGDVEMDNLDVQDIPLATEGFKGAAYKFLVPPTRALAASDKFFRTLTEGGERAALELRQTKGVKVDNLADAAKDAGLYRTFMQDTKPGTQGGVLNTIDGFTNMLMEARGGSKGEGVAQIAKWTIPFVKTPMNIFKQGLEYSPAGFATIPGAANKQQQLAKAMLGSSVFMGAATVLASGRLTWAEPTDEKGRQTFKEAGMQPYSIKMGDKWVQFSKMPPAVAFPFAMVAAVDDALNKKTINQDTADAITGAIAKYGNFLADQSYAKNVGDALAAVKGDSEAMTRFIGNYPQQLFPWRAASGWVARLGDDTERRANPDNGFIDKQVQTFMMSVPGLRTQTPARMDSAGMPLKTNNGTFNNLSPFKVTNEYPAGAAAFKDLMQGRIDNKNKAIAKEEGKSTIQATSPSKPKKESTGSTTLDASRDRVEKLKSELPKDMSEPSTKILTRYATLNEEGKKKFKADPKNRFELNVAEFEKNKRSGKLTGAAELKAQVALRKESVTHKYSQEVQDFYQLSKDQQNTMFKIDRKKATELYNKAKEMDAELTKVAGSETKYKNGLATGRRTGTGSRGGRGSNGGSPLGKLDYASRLATTNKTASATTSALRELVRKPKITRKSVSSGKLS
jgi:hypothetical protein